MKHFIGGFAFGFLFALIFLDKKEKPDFTVQLAAYSFIGVLFGLSAWGLLS